MALQAAPLIGTTEPSNSVPGSSDRHGQLLTAGNFKIIWNLDKILVALCVMISVIVQKNNNSQTDDHQSGCELFWNYSYDPNQERSTTGFQTFDTGTFVLSLMRTNKKIGKTLNIISLNLLTLSCQAVTKENTYLNKPAANVYDVSVTPDVKMV